MSGWARHRDRPVGRLARFLLLSPQQHMERTAPRPPSASEAPPGRTRAHRAKAWFDTPAFPRASGALLGALGLGEALRMGEATAVAAVTTALAATLPLMWRRAHPGLAGHLVILAAPLNFLVRPNLFVAVCIGGLLGFYTLARHRVHHPGAVAAYGVALMVVVDLLHVATDVFDGPSSDPVPLGAPGSLAYFAESFLMGVAIVAAVSAGDAVRSREGASRERSAAQAELIRLARQDAAEAERRAVARELHDIVAHSVSVIAVQAESATYTTPGLSPEARAGFQQIAGSSREALNELRQLLNVLRSSDGVPRSADGKPARRGAEAPQPTLDRLDELLSQHGAGGGRAGLTVTGGRRHLPASAELTAFRIVQEALTNVRRHAPNSTAEVELRFEADRLVVRVADDGPGAGAAHGAAGEDGQGHGLVGMRERVSLAGGLLSCGPGRGGGFVVHAELPVSAPDGTNEWSVIGPERRGGGDGDEREEAVRSW
ncbi:sensor histidine kinase [Streptomyces sp. NPDC017979]|uniref:sensor histidine kinase n=1 Tax=Streptomyces sp. NPDC017979 TaxID=3365024 RepID=UPI0037A74DA0